MTFASRPSTKLAALTCPFKCAAARSRRQGVTRLSKSISAASEPAVDYRIDRADRIGFRASAPSRLWPVDPRRNVQMRPALGVGDKTVEEKRGGDGPGQWIVRRVVDVGNLAVHGGFIGSPQRKPPHRIVHLG